MQKQNEGGRDGGENTDNALKMKWREANMQRRSAMAAGMAERDRPTAASHRQEKQWLRTVSVECNCRLARSCLDSILHEVNSECAMHASGSPFQTRMSTA